MRLFRLPLTIAATVLLAPAAGAQSTFNPTIPAAGFNVFTKSAVQFSAGDTHGPVATGGDAILAGSTIVSMNYNGYYPNGNGNPSNYGLVIGGRVWYNSGNQTQLNRGELRLGSTAGSNVYYINSNAGNAQVQLAAGAQNSNPNIQSNSTMPLNGVSSATGLNFTTAFNALNNYSSIINNYPATHSTSSTINFLAMPRTTGGGSQTITLSNGKVNYLSLSGAQLTAMESSGITYVFSQSLDSSTVVVFNVTATGTYNWNPAAFGGISDNSMGDGRFILYNFPNATRVNITGGRSTIGAILAPGAAVYKTGGNNAAGSIIADTFSMQYGEVHYAPFGGMLPGTGSALALEELQLSGSVIAGQIRINWQASGIPPASQLTMERSTDGIAFQREASLPNAERGTWLEPAPAGVKRIYYRLRAAYGDQLAIYSSVWVANLDGRADALTIAPSPFKDVIRLSHVSGLLRWELWDLRGLLLRSGSCANDSDITGLGALPNGSYLLKTSSEKGTSSVVLVKE